MPAGPPPSRDERTYTSALDEHTYTSAEVVEIFTGYGVSLSALQSWDRLGIFRPTYYEDADGRMSREQRDTKIQERGGPSRGDPHRAYSYNDLVWLRVLLYVSTRFRERGVASPARRASDVVLAAKGLGYESPPHAARFFFIDQHVYLVDGSPVPQCLTAGNQLPFVQIFACEFSAELEGRMRVLERFNRIDPNGRPAADDEAQPEARSAHG